MSEHTAVITWSRLGATFTDNRYSRAHTWLFDGGVKVPASSSPHVVPAPMSEPTNVDPEEAYVAALSSCHMLSFLGISAKRSFVVESYRDKASGKMAKNERGRQYINHVTLAPEIVFSGDLTPTEMEIETMHHEAHDVCYLANSVNTHIEIKSGLASAAPTPHP